jgi:hypothetical protein
MKPEADQPPFVKTANPFVKRMRRHAAKAAADVYAGTIMSIYDSRGHIATYESSYDAKVAPLCLFSAT